MRKFPHSPPKGYSGEINLSLPDFFYAEPGSPPLREYKQPMAMYETSPHPGSIKKKIRNRNIPRSPLKIYSGEKIRRNSPILPPKGYSGEINLNLPDLFYAEPGGPPLREYKQSMAMYETSPHPSPVKRKLNKGG